MGSQPPAREAALSQLAWHAAPPRVKAVGGASLRCQLPDMPNETLPPAAIVAVHGALTAVTALPLCWTVAPQEFVTRWSPRKLKLRDQPVIDAVLRLGMVTCA